MERWHLSRSRDFRLKPRIGFVVRLAHDGNPRPEYRPREAGEASGQSSEISCRYWILWRADLDKLKEAVAYAYQPPLCAES